MATCAQVDLSCWNSVTEASIFLGQGLKYAVETVEPPCELLQVLSRVNLDSKVLSEVAESLLQSCSSHCDSYSTFFKYRQRALYDLWKFQDGRRRVVESIKSSDKISRIQHQPGEERVSFTSHVSLLLLLPLLNAECRKDSALASQVVELLLQCLKECPPNSLKQESPSCLNGLENLLCSWLETGPSQHTSSEPAKLHQISKESALSALISLACGRLSLRLLVRSLNLLLEHQNSLGNLPIGGVIKRSLDYEREGGLSMPSCLLASHHITTWQIDGLVAAPPTEHPVDFEMGRNMCCDGSFLYMTNPAGQGLFKIGTGRNGTIKGHVYAQDPLNSESWVAQTPYGIIKRNQSFDAASDKLGVLIDPITLKEVTQVIFACKQETNGSLTRCTVQLISDGLYLYWIWYWKRPSSNSRDNQQHVEDVYLDFFTLLEDEVNKTYLAVPMQPTVLLKCKEGAIPEDKPATTTNTPPLSRVNQVMSSCGILLNTLHQIPIFTCGSNIVMILAYLPSTVHGSPLIPINRYTVNYCFSIITGQYLRNEYVVDFTRSSLWQSVSFQKYGMCFDGINGLIWSSSGNRVDEWANGGYSSLIHIGCAMGMTDTQVKSEVLNSDTAIECLVVQISFLAKVLQSKLNVALHTDCQLNIHEDNMLNSTFLELISTGLQKGLDDENIMVIKCMLSTLKVMFMVVSYMQNPYDYEEESLKKVRSMIWKLVYSFGMGHTDIQDEACKVLRSGLSILYSELKDQSAVILVLLNEAKASNKASKKLIDGLLCDLAAQLEYTRTPQCRLSGWLLEEVTGKIVRMCFEEAHQLIQWCKDANPEEIQTFVNSQPVCSPCQQYIRVLIHRLLWEWAQNYRQNSFFSKNVVESLFVDILEGSHKVFIAMLEVSSSFKMEDSQARSLYRYALECVGKSTIIGQCLPSLVATITTGNCFFSFIKLLVPKVVHASVASSKLAALHAPHREHFACLAREGCDYLSLDDTLLSEDVPLVEIPQPWTAKQTVESIHPLPNEYRFTKTIRIFGSKSIFVKFDARCATQYEYDKVILYAGPSTCSRKIGEYGGNNYGAGGRSVVRTGWPKELVKVEGDTLTVFFQVKSTREHSTPDKAIWGFKLNISSKESLDDEYECNLPLTTDLAFGLCHMAYTTLLSLYNGPEILPSEKACTYLLDSHLLQKCTWNLYKANINVVLDQSTNIVNGVTKDVLGKLRSLSKISSVCVRPSLKSVIQDELMERFIVGATVKHLGLERDINRYQVSASSETVPDEFVSLQQALKDVHLRVNSLVRQLQALAGLEKAWWSDAAEIKDETMQPSAAFFNDYHLQETKTKDLEMLCQLKDVKFDPLDYEKLVGNLIELLEQDSKAYNEQKNLPFPKTTSLVMALLEKAKLLLCVITNTPKQKEGPERSISHFDVTPHVSDITKDNTFLDAVTSKSSGFSRSISAPSQLQGINENLQKGIEDVKRVQRWRAALHHHNSILEESNPSSENKNSESLMAQSIAELFAFIGSHPDKEVSSTDFLGAITMRYERGKSRKQALAYMAELLSLSNSSEIVQATMRVHIASILRCGPRISDLHCSGMGTEIQEAYTSLFHILVHQMALNPRSNYKALLLLSITSFTRHEASCLMRSGLIYLLDKLSTPNGEKDNVYEDIRAMAWSSARVLIAHCVKWEQEKDYKTEDIEWSGLAHQVSTLITNHLTEILTQSPGTANRLNDPLQNVIELLLDMSKSKMGEAVLSQPCTMSALLSMLVDSVSAPRRILSILKLCHVALPLMTSQSFSSVELPAIIEPNCIPNQDEPLTKITKLLFYKLGECIAPCGQPFIGSSGIEQARTSITEESDTSGDKEQEKMSVYIHKRDDQAAHEVVQKLLSADGQPFVFRVGQGSEMERVVRIDRSLTEHGMAEVLTDSQGACFRRATKLAQAGLVTSVEYPGRTIAVSPPETVAGLAVAQAPDAVCNNKNTEIARYAASRPFISGNVAYTIASEIMSLFYSLVSSSEDSAKLWKNSLSSILHMALSKASVLMTLLEQKPSSRSSSASDIEDTEEPNFSGLDLSSKDWLCAARDLMAALFTLGGFKDRVRPGSPIQFVGDGMSLVTGSVVSIAERQSMVTVLVDEQCNAGFADMTLEVPLSRIKPVERNVISPAFLLLSEKVVETIRVILFSDGLTSVPLHAVWTGDMLKRSLAMTRVLAEIRSRASVVLNLHMLNTEFAQTFFNIMDGDISVLKKLAHECDTGKRQDVEELHCDQLRMVYRDHGKLSQPASMRSIAHSSKIVLDPARNFPAVRGCVFSETMCSVSFMADVNAGGTVPRGSYVYATLPIPFKAPSFYWEIIVTSLAQSADHETGPALSFGLTPTVQKTDTGWTTPIGSCLLHSNGRAVHYRPGGLLQWKTVNLNIIMARGDILGCGWQKIEAASELQGRSVGQVFFTYNGRRLTGVLDNVDAGMWPVLHIQRKNVKVGVNFGEDAFAFPEGIHHRKAAEINLDIESIQEGFAVLPFSYVSDSESDNSVASANNASGPETSHYTGVQPGMSMKDYDSSLSLFYRLFSSYDNMLDTGPSTHMVPDEDGDEKKLMPCEDPRQLLIKAWEEKVFPTIRRRFRNDADRRSGLEQIRGALLAGMVDIAVSTVADLYEDSGGIPPDLVLPRIEDIKDDSEKINISSLSPGMPVVIQCSVFNNGSLPAFATAGMHKTFGLTGVVQTVDKVHGLVEVETYVRDEGTLASYWYPVGVLKRPTVAFTRSSSVALAHVEDPVTAEIHRELIQCEKALVHMHCRGAYIRLMSQEKVLTATALDTATKADLIQLIANHRLVSSCTDGNILPSFPLQSPSPHQCLLSASCSPLKIFFRNHKDFGDEYEKMIQTADRCGPDGLNNLVESLCACLKTAPVGFCHEEYPVTENKIVADVYYPGAAAVVISCRDDPSVSAVWNALKGPWARFYCYYGTNKLSRNGKVGKYQVLQYPFTAEVGTVSSLGAAIFSGSTLANSVDYPQKILPTNRLHISVGGSLSPGCVVDIHTLPSEFLVSLAFIESLLKHIDRCNPSGSYCHEEASNPLRDVPSAERKVVPVELLVAILEMLVNVILQLSMPPIIKELIFHLLAQLLRTIYQYEMNLEVYEVFVSLVSRLSPLQIELRKLVEKEVSVTNTTALDFILKCDFEHDKFTSYFQALIEVVLALGEVQAEGAYLEPKAKTSDVSGLNDESTDGNFGLTPTTPHSPEPDLFASVVSNDSVVVPMNFEFPLSESSESGGTSPLSPLFPAYHHRDVQDSGSPYGLSRNPRRQRLRSRRLAGMKRIRGGHGSSSEDQKGVREPGCSIPWLTNVLSITKLLRYVVDQDREESINSAVHEAITDTTAVSSDVLSRLLVITGIPVTLDERIAREAIIKACRSSGGLYNGGIYLPVPVNMEMPSFQNVPSLDDPHFTEDVFASAFQEVVEGMLNHRFIKVLGHAVVMLRIGGQRDRAIQSLTESKTLKLNENSSGDLKVFKVNSELMMENGNDSVSFKALEEYLKVCLLENGEGLSKKALEVFTEIFKSCSLSAHDKSRNAVETTSCSKDSIVRDAPGNILLRFFDHVKPVKKTTVDVIMQVLRTHGEAQSDREEEEKFLSVQGLLEWVEERAKQDIRAVWRALIACGYNFQLERFTHILPAEMIADMPLWSLKRDQVLVQYVNTLCRSLATSPSRLQPDEVYLTEADLISPELSVLRGLSQQSLGNRFVFLKNLNTAVERLLLPVTDLRVSRTYSLSLAALLSQATDVLFYDTKVAFTNRVVNISAHRRADQSSPEVSLDPLETLEANSVSAAGPQFFQAAKQLAGVPSARLRVKLATGGDPVFPLRVHLRGEQVLGSGGSFRHFMWHMARELQGLYVGLLLPCPSTAANRNKGKYMLTPGPMTYQCERKLIFLGQLLGIAIRADIPLNLDLLPSFWKSLLRIPVTVEDELPEADILTYNYIQRLSQITTEGEFSTLCGEANLWSYMFVYTSIAGEEVELCNGGANRQVTWENLQEYIKLIREFRLCELEARERMDVVRCGFASIVPIQLLSMLSPLDLQIRVCGLPELDLDFLRVHTTYVAGVKTTDIHIEYFWNTLESFSQDQLRKFVKFACNQERLPSRCTCQEGTPNANHVHVPPYPMKIGPPDGRGPPNMRYIRVETCMFMVKLPQYSSQEIMTEKLLYAINCREDPLTDLR